MGVAIEAEVIPEDPTEAGWPQRGAAAVERLSAIRKLQVVLTWPAITVVRSIRHIAGVSLPIAVPRQLATTIREIQLQTLTATRLRKPRSRPGMIRRSGVRQRTIEKTIGTAGERRMMAAYNSSKPTESGNGAAPNIFGTVGMWLKPIIAAIGEVIEIELQRSGTAAGWRYGTACGTTTMASSMTDGGQVAAGGQDPLSVGSRIPGGGGELAVGTR
jgi:hypothetical protein